MFNPIKNLSLRARLAWLAGFAIVALLVALFVACRLVRATETFALRQADSSVRAAARDLAREIQAHPAGYRTLDEASTASDDHRPGPRDHGPRDSDRRGRPVPQHIPELFAVYADPWARLTAITLHRTPEVAGGFYRPAGAGPAAALVGFADARDAGAGPNDKVPAEVADAIRDLCLQSAQSGATTTRTIQVGAERILLAAVPVERVGRELNESEGQPAEGGTPNGITAAWAMQRVSNLSGVSDRGNLAALLALGLCILAVSGVALITVRDLRSGVAGIESGLTGLKSDLGRPIPAPHTAELARIAVAVNELAASLQANIERRSELEHELTTRERLAALGRVVAGVAHEVRNPLAAIKLKVQLAQRSASPDKLDDTFRVVTEEIDRLDTLVRKLLELGRDQTMISEPVDLYSLAGSRVALFADLAIRSGVEIAWDRPAGRLEINGDGDRLAQVFDNLIQNAIEAMPHGGRLNIKGARDGQTARITLQDSGRGIPAAQQEHIFEPFQTGRDTGTGLGLAIARAIVEEHGGRISFISQADQESQESSGTTFTLEFPLAKTEVAR
ncbi:MAG: HAMP domain-containing sensor histidine kinase [Pyrinomonadaceae bacterium]